MTSTAKRLFSPSINIERDQNVHIDYLKTPNAERIFEQISTNYRQGIHAFTIVGSYGTGKSAFLVALQQTLQGEASYFAVNGQFNGIKQFVFLSITAQYTSIIESFAQYLDCQPTAEGIFRALQHQYKAAQKKGKGYAIVIDELGKFLEYAAKHNAEQELYFIQQLAEFVGQHNHNVLLIGVLHQGFEAYSRRLDYNERQEWEKVKGRLKELTFNEPIEQLMLLASMRLGHMQPSASQRKQISALLKMLTEVHLSPTANDFIGSLAPKILPFDILSLNILAQALRKYGQNERSLFTFLESHEYFGIQDSTIKFGNFYGIAQVYDYLSYNFFHFIYSKDNPDFLQWRAIGHALERVDGVMNLSNLEEYEIAKNIIKVIGLANIFTSQSGKIDEYMLTEYIRLVEGFQADAIQMSLKLLESRKIIRFLNFKSRYVLFEGTDIDIEVKLREARAAIEPVTDIVGELQQYFSFPVIPAKRTYIETGTPRYFEFRISDAPINAQPEGEIDGFINLIFSETLSIDEVQQVSKKQKEAVLYGLYKNTLCIKKSLEEIRAITYALSTIDDDKIARRELLELLDVEKQNLNGYVIAGLHTSDGENGVVWFKAGTNQPLIILHREALNRCLSELCQQTYKKSPKFFNELVNRHKLSGAISTARKNLFERLVNDYAAQDIGFPSDKYPPEKSIYLSLLKKTGIHRYDGHNYILAEPTENSFGELWKASEHFLGQSKSNRKNLSEFVEYLSQRPFKLKQGFVDFWLPLFLFIKREEFALYDNGVFVPIISAEVIDLIVRKPQAFSVKAFDIQGVRLDIFNRYRELINQHSSDTITKQGFIEVISPFVQFYRGLPQYAKVTQRLTPATLRFRDAIAHAKDPEQTFFEDFPAAFGHTLQQLEASDALLQNFTLQIQASIRELREAFPTLLERFESALLHTIGEQSRDVVAYKRVFQQRYKDLKTFLMLPQQTTFTNRLFSKLDDKNAWLSSLIQALLNKSPEQMRDEEEEKLLADASSMLFDLDNLCDIAAALVDVSAEAVVQINITPLQQEPIKQLIRLPRTKEQELDMMMQQLRTFTSASSDKALVMTALTRLLQEVAVHE